MHIIGANVSRETLERQSENREMDAAQVERYLELIARQGVADLRAVWSKWSAESAADLPHQIEEFAAYSFRALMERDKILLSAPPSFLWKIVMLAILEAKTHSPSEIETAKATVDGWYLTPPPASAGNS